jgi:hypothetical protein
MVEVGSSLSSPDEGLPDGVEEDCHAEGFDQKPHYSRTNIRQVLVAGIPAHKDEGEFGMQRTPALRQRIARSRLGLTRQMYVSDDELDRANAEALFNLLSLLVSGGADDSIAVETQGFRERLPHGFFIVNDEHGSLGDIVSTVQCR